MIFKWGTFSPLSSLIILLLVYPSNLIVSGVKSLRQYPVLISYVILFSILPTYIILGGLLVTASCFLMIYLK